MNGSSAIESRGLLGSGRCLKRAKMFLLLMFLSVVIGIMLFVLFEQPTARRQTMGVLLFMLSIILLTFAAPVSIAFSIYNFWKYRSLKLNATIGDKVAGNEQKDDARIAEEVELKRQIAYRKSKVLRNMSIGFFIVWVTLFILLFIFPDIDSVFDVSNHDDSFGRTALVYLYVPVGFPICFLGWALCFALSVILWVQNKK